MALKSVVFTLIGVAVAGGSVYLTREMLDSQNAGMQANATQMEMVNVIVARIDVPFGRAIDPTMLTTQRWPAEFVPGNMFTSIQRVVGDNPNEPRRARRHISAGEPILFSKVSDFGERVTIVQTLGPNRRAISIQVDAVTSVAGFVTPGDRVDILLTQGSGEDMNTTTLLHDVRVIGTDQDADESRDTARVARTVTVDVSPEEGQRLALAQRVGRLSLSLRTLEDAEDNLFLTQMTTVHDLQGGRVTEDIASDSPTRIRIRRGSAAVEDVTLR